MLKVLCGVWYVVSGKLIEALAAKVGYIWCLRCVQLSKTSVVTKLSDTLKSLRAHFGWIETCPNAEFLWLSQALSSQRIWFVSSVYFLLLIEIGASVLRAWFLNLPSINLLSLSKCKSLLMLLRRKNSIWILIRADHDVWIFYDKIVTWAHVKFQCWRLYIVTMYFSKGLVFHSNKDLV